MISIRPFEERDWDATWRMIQPVLRAGETYAFSPDITEEEAHKAWVDVPLATFVGVGKKMISLVPTSSGQINPLSGLMCVTVATSFQSRLVVKVLDPQCVNIRSVRPYPEASEQ